MSSSETAEPADPPDRDAATACIEALCGRELARKAIAEIGAERSNLGVSADRYVGIAIDDSLPFMVSEAEARLLEAIEGTRRVSDSFLIVGHGGLPAEATDQRRGGDSVTRFRSYNLAHAELLESIVDPTPLTRARVSTMIESMDRIVDDFIILFASSSHECSILPEVYGSLKKKILVELEREDAGCGSPAELSRLVQTFDDPDSLGTVQTLHGLKRYLHQRGLKLGMGLVRGARATNRTVDLVLGSGTRVLRCIRRIRYADFDAVDPDDPGRERIPGPVGMAIDAYGRQLLHGQDKFPHLEIFCYGNEVHYYLSFWNHPALLRVDHSPPLRGGMIDLAYYGVSNYDEAIHPDPSLGAIREFLHRLDFDVEIDCSRIHARFDREQTLDPSRLRERVEAVLRLAPYMMDIDWTIGSLALDAPSRRKVAENWADSFRLWGVLPLHRLLTKDRRRILVAVERDALGECEVAWSGDGPYRDRFGDAPNAHRFAKAAASLARLGAEGLPELHDRQPVGQLELERRLLVPLREAASRGAVTLENGEFRRVPATLFQGEHEVEYFARVLARGPKALAGCISAARLIPVLTGLVRFVTTGTCNGYEVQRARIDLWDETLGLHVLRDSQGIARLAVFSRGTRLYRRRLQVHESWQSNASQDVADMARLLCRANYLTPTPEWSAGADPAEASALCELLRRPNPRRLTGSAGRRLIRGLQASPGRTAGRALFGTEGRTPEQFEDAILVASAIRPEDNNFIYRSSGVVTTGGGILSHAGLLAVQFGKPALVVSGRWQRKEGHSTALLFTTEEYLEEERLVEGNRIRLRRDVREQEHCLREGDLVVLDGADGTLQLLGQDPATLALHEELRRMGNASRRTIEATSDRQLLHLRGERLRAQRQIAKLLERLTDRDVARYAVRELLLGGVPASGERDEDQRSRLLSCALGNPQTGDDSRECLVQALEDLSHRFVSARNELLRRVPAAPSLFEVLSLRRNVLDARRSLARVIATLEACGLDCPRVDVGDDLAIDGIARARLQVLRDACALAIRRAVARGPATGLRHRLRQLDRYDLVLRTPATGREPFLRIRADLEALDSRARRRSRGRRILTEDECGFGLFPLIGWKAANLAEIGRLGGPGLVPRWFVVTRRAFDEVLDSPVRGATSGDEGDPSRTRTLRESIEVALGCDEWNLEQKSRRIRQLWENVELSRRLVGEITTAYRRLVGEAKVGEDDVDAADAQFVAIRSSSVEEDAEDAARAGEFETFLFIRGEASLVAHLRRAWSGLWTERAIHNRAVFGSPGPSSGGGIIVQRIIRARVAGVLQTVNVGMGMPNEVIVNVGLGLGEGIVGGIAAADQYTVAKEGDPEHEPLRFRCVMVDKAEQIAFNRRLGTGTVRQPSAPGERLRPALDGAELRELVRTSLGLERAYGYPLDIEFAFEERRLQILQARPVVTYHSTLRETLERWPLLETAPSGRAACPMEECHDPP